jgi:hypothetical protein
MAAAGEQLPYSEDQTPYIAARREDHDPLGARRGRHVQPASSALSRMHLKAQGATR